MSRRTDRMWAAAMRVTALKVVQPSPTQVEMLKLMRTDGPLRRLAGGFWVAGVRELNYNGAPVDSPWCDVRTVRAMEKRGWVERSGAFTEEWRDSRLLTDAGRAVIE